ncbi:hypothetical protein [Nocardia arizonensis]|uniref:hypothetical protein n=1 Tax=Nocardia arizonensis TaxID=1141647 RepID=UPI0006D2147C|nr:hypothetical protein [Nocardia arizonensis]
MIVPIGIKVNLDGRVAEALTRLGCAERTAVTRDIWFAEAHGGPGPALLTGRIVIRLRSGGPYDDLTVKLRPCLRPQLTGRWTAPFDADGLEYRIAADWCEDRRTLSASALGRRPRGSVRRVARRGVDVISALESAQRQFLVSCTPPGVAVDRLVVLGPVASTKWTAVRLDGLEVDVERWQVGELDMLELLLRVIPVPGESHADLESRAALDQRVFESAVRAAGLRIAAGPTKTERVLTALTARPTHP